MVDKSPEKNKSVIYKFLHWQYTDSVLGIWSHA